LPETLAVLRPGDLHVAEDMQPLPKRLTGHAAYPASLIETPENLGDFLVTKLSWASGLVIAEIR